LSAVAAKGNQRVLQAGEVIETFLTVTLYQDQATPTAVARTGDITF
jgi:hypothetical protein